MPFESKAQQRFMFAAEDRGEVPKGTAERWAKHTPDIKGLPEKKAALSMAADLGRYHALQEAGIDKEALSGPLTLAGKVVIPGTIGYALAPDEHRGTGFAAGALGGMMGKGLVTQALKKSQVPRVLGPVGLLARLGTAALAGLVLSATEMGRDVKELTQNVKKEVDKLPENETVRQGIKAVAERAQALAPGHRGPRRRFYRRQKAPQRAVV